MDQPTIQPDVLDRHLANDSKPSDKAAIDAWLDAHPNAASAVTILREARAGAPLSEAQRKEMWVAVSAGMQDQKMVSASPKAAKRRLSPLYHLAWVVPVVGLFSWQQLKPVSQRPTVDVYTTYTTVAGQRASITLSDGSRVTLGPVTTLRVRKAGLHNQTMLADVTGEALFSINRSASRAFSVTAHGVTTRVLGTEFVVRAYDPSLVRVAVRDGRVSVQPQTLTVSNAAIVNAGEVTLVTPSAQPTVSIIPDLATEFAWANGELVLRNVPLGEAFVRLSRWYGMEFRVAHPTLLKAPVDATFPSNFSKLNIEVLARAVGARAVYSNNVITFQELP